MYSSPVPSQPINLLTFPLGLPSPTSSHFPVPPIYTGFQPRSPASFPPFHSKSTFTPTLTSSALSTHSHTEFDRLGFIQETVCG